MIRLNHIVLFFGEKSMLRRKQRLKPTGEAIGNQRSCMPESAID
jgi:hypothetical protein